MENYVLEIEILETLEDINETTSYEERSAKKLDSVLSR